MVIYIMPPKKLIATTNKSNKTIEEMYQSMTHEEQILARPDTYIGDIHEQKEEMYVYDERLKKIVLKTIDNVPGLYKIFDEILMNASDQTSLDKTCNSIWVDIDQITGTISVQNNGAGIDVEIHDKHECYVPEMIFGRLLTSTNYDDTEQRTTGGRNGYGAKLTNLFSKKFIVDTFDLSRHMHFYQEFSNNMQQKTQPLVKHVPTLKTGYVKITFIPDFEKFKLFHDPNSGKYGLSNDTIALFKKRVYDLAGVTSKCKIYFNKEHIDCKDFKTYINMYHFSGMKNENFDGNEQTETFEKEDDSVSNDDNAIANKSYQLYYEIVNENWTVGFMYAPDDGPQQISFVNGICTYRGGTHVKYVTDMVVDSLRELILKKYKDINVKPDQIKNNLIVFIKSTIINPSFDTQTKEALKTKVSEFGSKCVIKPKLLAQFSKSGILNMVMTLVHAKEMAILKKTDGKKVKTIKSIAKLEDAVKAGTDESHLCYLILTEGDSAKALAISGRAVVGSEYFGVFPLKGKLMNVRNLSPAKAAENEEITNIKKIMGLEQEKTYTDVSELRYGGIIIMTDADVDGSHIKGLLLNFIHVYWPSLLKIPNFITSLATPIVKAVKGTSKTQKLEFYNLTDYNNWKDNTNTTGWHIKYFKGLGTSTPSDAKEYFTDIYEKLIGYIDPSNKIEKIIENDKENKENKENIKHIHSDETTEYITLGFDESRTDDRKKWLSLNSNPDILDISQKTVPISDFINKELIHFSHEDNNRSLPGPDGLKPSQRKVLYSALKKRLDGQSKEIKVAQFAGYISEHTCYHHGEASIIGAVVKMAQNFVCSNNINLLHPSGMFGTRLTGGKDHAQPRYIFTYLEKLTRLIMRSEDEEILEYLNDDGYSIEPKYFLPIIPLVLVNGSSGIGTGYASNIPCYNPLTVIDNLLSMIHEQNVQKLHPWYKHFKGSIIANVSKPHEYYTYGIVKQISSTKLEITELPIGCWTTPYKMFLENLEKTNFIKTFSSNITETSLNIIVEFDQDKLASLMGNTGMLYSKLGLVEKINTANMTMFKINGKIHKYSSPEEILEDFYEMRMDGYEKRKSHLIQKYKKELDILSWKLRFVKDVVNDVIIVSKQKKQHIIEKLIGLGYPTIEDDNNYHYLLDSNILSLTEEKIEELEEKCRNKEKELALITNTSEEQMWENELNELRAAYVEWLADCEKNYSSTNNNSHKPKNTKSSIKSNKTSKIASNN